MRKPLQVDVSHKNWGGAQDARTDFAVQYDDKNLYVAARVWDNALITSASVGANVVDNLELRVRPVPAETSATAVVADTPKSKAEAKRAAHHARQASKQQQVLRAGLGTRADLPAGCSAAAAPAKGGYTVEFSVPLTLLDDSADWSDFQLNLVVTDRDVTNVPDHVRLWWMPDWQGAQYIPGAGVFLKKDR
jgi:hypothetical protein